MNKQIKSSPEKAPGRHSHHSSKGCRQDGTKEGNGDPPWHNSCTSSPGSLLAAVKQKMTTLEKELNSIIKDKYCLLYS